MKKENVKTGKKGVSRFGRVKLFILLGVLIYASVTFVNQQSILAVQLYKSTDLAQREEALQREIDYLRNELNYIGTDEYVEQQARIRLGWLYPDETKYVEGAPARQSAGQPAQTAEESVSPQDGPAG